MKKLTQILDQFSGGRSAERRSLLTQIEAYKVANKKQSQAKPINDNTLPIEEVLNKIYQTTAKQVQEEEKIGLRNQTIFAMLDTGLQDQHRERIKNRSVSQALLKDTIDVYTQYYYARDKMDELAIQTMTIVRGECLMEFLENISLPIDEYMRKIVTPSKSLVEYKNKIKQLESDLRSINPELWISKTIKFAENYSQ